MIVREFFRGAWVVGYREILRLTGQRTRLVAAILTPLLVFGLFAAGFHRLVGEIEPGLDLTTFMFPGVVAMAVIMPAVFTGMSVVWDREFGFLREVLVSPLSRTGIAVGKVGGGALVATAEGLVLLAFAPVVGIRPGPVAILETAGILLLLATAVAAFGILVGVRIRSQETFQSVMALLVFPLIFLSGVFFPVDAMPGWMALLARLNPVTYGVDAVRGVILGEAAPAGSGLGLGSEALILLVAATVLILLASRSFREE